MKMYVVKMVCYDRDLPTPINVGDLIVAQIRDPIYSKPKQRPCAIKTLKGSEVELNIEAKVENIEIARIRQSIIETIVYDLIIQLLQ